MRRHGRVIDRCRLRTSWVAGLPQAPQPSPPPPGEPPAPVPGAWSAQFTSDQGDYIGQGESWSFAPPANGLQVSGTRSHVTLESGDWTADFTAPPGQQLAVGRYDGARRYPFNDEAPGLSISGDGRGCNELSGTFTVNKIEFDAAGTLRAFEVTFEQHCEHFVPALRGTWIFAAA